MDNRTRGFLGVEYNWSKASIELMDKQPLHGGVRVYLPGWTIGQVFVSRFAPGGQETKYRIPLGLQEKVALCQLFIEQDFLTIQPEERSGIPDEARPSITLTNSTRESHTVSKWHGVADARFDVLYRALYTLSERTKDHKPIPEKFKAWQKAVVIAGLVVGLLGSWLVASALARSIVLALWLERIALALGLLFFLLLGVPILIRALVWRERKKSREDRLLTHSLVAVIIWLLFFMALIACGDILWYGVKSLWHGESLMANGYESQYIVFAYAALFTLYFVAGVTAFLGQRFLDWVDERF